MQSLSKDKAVADDHDDIESSQDDTWSRQNHGAQAIKPRKRGISNPTAPPSKVRQRKTHMEKCADYEFQTASMTMAAQRVVDFGTLEELGPSAKEKELEARAASLQKTAMAKVEGFLKLNSDWMSLASNFTGLSMSDSEAQCSNDPNDLITHVGRFSAAIGDRSSTIQHFKQEGDGIKIEKERTRALGSELEEYKEKWVATRKVEQRLRSERNTLCSQNFLRQNQIESLQRDEERSASHIHKLESDLQQLKLDLVSANSEIGALRGSLTSETMEHSEAMHRLRELEHLLRQQEQDLDSLRELGPLREKAKRLQDDLRHNVSNLQLVQVALDRSRASADASADKIRDLRSQLRALNSAKDEVQMDRDNILSDKIGLEKEKDGLLSATAIVEKEKDRLLSKRATMKEERDRLFSEKTTLQGERDGLISDMITLQEERDSLLSERTTLQDERDSLLSERTTLQEERDDLLSERTTLQEERDSLLSERTILQEERDDLLLDKSRLQKEKASLKSESSRLQREQNGLLSERDKMQREKNYLQVKRDQSKRETDSLRSKNANLEETLANLESQKSRLEKENRDQLMESLRGRIERLAERDKTQKQ